MLRPQLLLVAALLALGLLVRGDTIAAVTTDVTTCGVATGNTPSANRLAFAACVLAATAGDTLLVPNGTYLFDVSALHSTLINKALTIRCSSQSGVLKFDASVTGGVGSTARLMEVTASDVTIDGCTLDGNKPNPNTLTVYDPNVEHHLGVFAGPTISNFTIRNTVVQNFEGDGLQIYTGVASPLIEDNTFQWNQRSGMSFTPTSSSGPVTDAIVRRNTFLGISGQPLDNEHGPVIGCEVYQNNFKSPDTNNYAVTVSGYTDGVGSANRSKNWSIHDNTLSTAIFVIRADNVTIEHNTTVSQYTKPCLDISRSAKDITYRNNSCIMTQVGTTTIPGVGIIGTKEDPACTTDADCDATAGSTCDTVTTHKCTPVYAYPENIVVGPGNVFQSYDNRSMCVRAEAFHSITVLSNTCIDNGPATAAGFAGMYLRATLEGAAAGGRDMSSAIIKNNWIQGYGQSGVRMQGNSAVASESLGMLWVEGNYFHNTVVTGPMVRGVTVDDDAQHATKEFVNINNTFGCGVATLISNLTIFQKYSGSPTVTRVSCPL